MALQFALRPRIRLREETERTRAVQLPTIALPVAGYWIVMGLLTYAVSRAPAWLNAKVDAPQQLATSLGERMAAAPMAAKAPESARESVPLELAPAWKDTPRVAEPALARSALAESVTAEASAVVAPPPRDEVRHTDRATRHAERGKQRSLSGAMPPANAQDHGGAPATWPVVPGLPPPAPERDHVAMRSTLDELWGDPGASNTPRASSPFDPTDGHAARDTPAPPSASRAALVAAGPRISTCESAIAGATDEIDMTRGRGAPDVSRDAYAAILGTGSYLSACSVPGGTVVEICAAVQHGRAVGVTVISRPVDARVNACVRGAVASLAFPANTRLDVTRTRFDALRAK